MLQLIGLAGIAWPPVKNYRPWFVNISLDHSNHPIHVYVCMYVKFQESQFKLRDSTTHKDQCHLVNGPDGSSYSKEFGINRESLLDSLKYFNTCSGGLLPDVMHDLLEGALQYEVKLMLKQFIFDKNFFTCDYLSMKLKNMELGYMECKDRPTSITDNILQSSDNRLHQNGKLFRNSYCVLYNRDLRDLDRPWAVVT